MPAIRMGLGEQIVLDRAASAQGSVPSSAIGGLSSRQVVFGSPSGGVAQDAIFQYDSSNGRIGVGTSSPTARFSAFPPDVTTAFNFDWYTSAGVHSGVINSLGHVGIGTTAPVAALTVADSTGGNITLTGGANAQIVAHGNLFIRTTGGNAINFQPQSDVLGPAGSFSSVGHFSAVNNVRLSSGTDVTFSAFGVAGTTQASSYTTGSASTGRTLPSTITTVAGLMSAAERENFNRVAQALETLVKKDLLGYGWTR